MKPIRIVIADDQALFREGLYTLLSTQADLSVVGEAGNGREALELVREHRADVVLMDLRMPVLDGVAATRELARIDPNCRVIILTTFDDDEYIFEGLRAGACGYLLKDTSAEELFSAIRVVAKGESFLQPAVATKVVAELNRLTSRAVPGESELLDSLSRRELEILRLVAAGASNKEIAAALFITEGTVKNHITNILDKLGVSDRTQAAVKAKELRLV
ncbi:MAG: response regulator transcription factor [Firmicutes bacterium]|nr:response regulator transcription factor [Bacillota bacterium]